MSFKGHSKTGMSLVVMLVFVFSLVVPVMPTAEMAQMGSELTKNPDDILELKINQQSKESSEEMESFETEPMISAGGGHSLALKDNGTVWAWGSNFNGQLGNGTNENEAAPIEVSSLTNVVEVSAAWDHSMALKEDGTVWSWGRNNKGQLGDNTTENRNEPVQVKNLENVVSIKTNQDHCLAAKENGTVWAWGANDSGQLGDGTTEERHAPVQVKGPDEDGYLEEVIEVKSGASHSMALKEDGTVWAWGG